MPGKIKVKVLAGRNLPVMDRAADTTDAFVEIKFGGVTHKTDVCRKSLNPHWNSTEWYRFEVDDSELQDEPLQLRLMDHDTYSANDAIGKVVVSLAPLLGREPLQNNLRPAHTTGAIMSGWIPVFDTMHGIRGELNIIVKVELFSDFNKFRQSSCGVRFFHCPVVPPGYRATAIHGFVEELIVNDDPEYQWIDKIRTPRASNEARQVAFIKLSNQVQRRVGLKAAELGANAVVGYKQSFDLEGESGVVARAIGTAVSIVALPTPCQPLSVPGYTQQSGGSPRTHARTESCSGKEHHTPIAAAMVSSVPAAASASLNATTPVGMHRRSSDSDLSITPKGGSLTNAGATNTSTSGGAILRTSMNANNLEMLEYPFLTMTEYPPNFIVHIGGMVCSRAVKLMDGADGGSRAAWWAEVRTEVRAHMRALRCTAVLGYNETAAICEDVCVLSASGTAAVIDLETDFVGDSELNVSLNMSGSAGDCDAPSALDDEVEVPPKCSLVHIPYSPSGMPYTIEQHTCHACGRSLVPNVSLSTLERPRALAAAGRSCLVTAAAARARRAPSAGEPAARDLSDQLPFLEYELHKLLYAKMIVQGANALFGVKTQIAVGERAVVALATGTGALVTALPDPRAPTLKPTEGVDIKATTELQKALNEALSANRARNGYEPQSPQLKTQMQPAVVGEDLPPLDLCGDKDACVLELDETEDVETARALAAQRPRALPSATTARVCGVRPLRAGRHHHFSQMYRARLALGGGGGGGGGGGAAERHVTRTLDGIHYKLRRLAPAALAALTFQLDLPEDEMQLLVSGVSLPLTDPLKPDSATTSEPGNTSSEDTIFTLDDEKTAEEKSVSPPLDQAANWNGGVVVTPLPRLSSARCQRWLCALHLLFVRETSSVRELGGLSGLLHTFITEVLAIVRAYTAALGGNALASFYITELMLQENPHRNQGQCLLSVGGDVVHVTY